MGLKRRMKYTDGLKYKGGGPMLAWILHRITAFGILLFVGLHVVADYFSIQKGADWATQLNTIYMSPWFQIIVAFCVIFHALNGLRVILLDFYPDFLRFEREAIWVEWLVILPLFILTTTMIVLGVFKTG
jgi:succinate dehydrogenase / fumarate reductase cytochrome b subunit